MVDYSDFVMRNRGYIATDVQERIRRTRVLVAGCGMGSTIPEALLRAGFLDLTLADGDRIEVHNLNRQNYEFADVGRPKVEALKDRLVAINPLAQITASHGWIDPGNAAGMVARADIVFDTIDFLSLEAITALHDECHLQRRPVISAMSAGFGAAAIYFPPGSPVTFRELFGLPEHGPIGGYSYVDGFTALVTRLAEHLEPEVVQAMAAALTVMQDGTPCPAPHTSSGSTAVASLAAAAAVRIVAGRPLTAAPNLMLLNMSELLTGAGVDLRPAAELAAG